MSDKKPFVLLILDGWGYRQETDYNAIAQAKTPHWDEMWEQCPHSLLSGSGEDVGLPTKQMGNSEVGHTCLGAGRVIYQDLVKINKAIDDGTFYQNKTLQKSLKAAAKKGAKVHLMGLLSEGGVHSHLNHFIATLNLAKALEVKDLYLHAFLDGRDCPPKSAQSSLQVVDRWFKSYGFGKIASLTGRYFAMDRDKRYERTKLAYDMLTKGQAPLSAPDPMAGLLQSYQREVTDEFVEPTIIGTPVKVEDGDLVIFINFRADRARQLSHALTSKSFNGFEREHQPKLANFVTMTHYDDQLKADVVFKPEKIQKTLGEVIQDNHLTQLRIAETEKYAHVTFFFNGGREDAFKGEERMLIPSPKVATYDLKPEMSAVELTDKLVAMIENQSFDLIVCNYANADMVGHTGNMGAAIAAVETLDKCLGRIKKAIESVHGQALITADHGNVEQMLNVFTGQPHTAHTTELVPLVYLGDKQIILKEGGLADVAPTILYLMDLSCPKQMTGKCLAQ